MRYITDATHFLDHKGAVAPQRGRARKLADFLGSIIVSVTFQGADPKQPSCFKCNGSVKAGTAVSGVIARVCSGCQEEGRISNWQRTLWDMTAARDEHGAEH